MNYSNVGKSTGLKFIFSLCLFFLGAGIATAQVTEPQQQQEQEIQKQQVPDNFSDEQLEKFVDVYVQVVEIQQQNEAKMMKAIEEENLDIARFNQLLEAQQQAQDSTAQVNASAEELAAFNNATEKIMEVQREAHGEMQHVIEQDLGLDTYQQIVIAYQQSAEVQQRVNELLQEKMNDVN